MGERRIAFFDRDGTLIEDRHYLADPAGVCLLPGAADAVRRVRAAGAFVVVITNQSGIARGFVTEAQYLATRARLAELMSAAGAPLDLQLHCPHYPTVTGPCDCRKPGTALHERAAKELNADLTTAMYVGDRWRDVAPGLTLGGRAFLVPSAATPADERERALHEGVLCDTLDHAVTRYLDHT